MNVYKVTLVVRHGGRGDRDFLVSITLQSIDISCADASAQAIWKKQGKHDYLYHRTVEVAEVQFPVVDYPF